MNESELRDWLQRADDAFAERQPLVTDAQACRQILTHRVRSRRVIAVSAGLLACLAAATALITNRPDELPMVRHAPKTTPEVNAATHPPRLNDEQVARIRRQAERYSQQAAEHQRIVTLLRQEQQLVQRQQELKELEQSIAGQLPATVRVQEEINRVAATQLVVAKRLAADFDDIQLAADAYRLVIAQFPDTHWAAMAAESLALLRSPM